MVLRASGRESGTEAHTYKGAGREFWDQSPHRSKKVRGTRAPVNLGKAHLRTRRESLGRKSTRKEGVRVENFVDQSSLMLVENLGPKHT
jgi:hypothetical protein